MDTTLTILLCLVAADFLTGLLHWWEDTYGDPGWPVIGELIVKPNILHHQDPLHFTTAETLFSRNYLQVVPASLLAAGVLFLSPSLWPVSLTLVVAAFGNEVHAWSHRAKNPWPVRLLQDTGILQAPRQHAKHHHAPFTHYYCTILNVTNAVLESLDFWRRLEYLIAGFGIYPKRGHPERKGY